MCLPSSLDFPGGSDDKASAYNASDDKASAYNASDDKASAYNVEDPGSIPGLGISTGEGNGNPLQWSCLENPMDEGAW